MKIIELRTFCVEVHSGKLRFIYYNVYILVYKGGAKMKMNALDWIAFILVMIGGLNWGLVGVGVGDVVAMIFGSVAWLLSLVYILVGLAALYMIIMAFVKK